MSRTSTPLGGNANFPELNSGWPLFYAHHQNHKIYICRREISGKEVNIIALTTYDWIYGTATIAVVFLSIVAGALAISLFKSSFRSKELKAWRFLIIALVLFAVEEAVGALKIFGIYSTPHLTHVIPGFILAAMIAAIVNQIYINKGCA